MSVAGTWNVTVQSPMGPQSGTMTIVVEGDRFRGTLANAMGTMELEDGRVAGNELTWTMALTMPMPIRLEAQAQVDGDRLEGTVKAGAFGAMALSGTRG